MQTGPWRRPSSADAAARTTCCQTTTQNMRPRTHWKGVEKTKHNTAQMTQFWGLFLAHLRAILTPKIAHFVKHVIWAKFGLDVVYNMLKFYERLTARSRDILKSTPAGYSAGYPAGWSEEVQTFTNYYCWIFSGVLLHGCPNTRCSVDTFISVLFYEIRTEIEYNILL